ncbi:MAG TPA: hypothetical protein ENK06_03330 [Gammaproteobacteria bacterium]|nr:hypothetical protein [Gammaproteobacteria bacterium]
MHPVIRLVCFIIFAAFVSTGQGLILLAGFLLLFLVWLILKQGPSPKAWLMLKRMRLFYLSILFIYLWFTPGEIMFVLPGIWSPTYEGFMLAAERILALCLLVFSVETLLRTTSRPLLLTGLYYLASPLMLLGVNRNQFIVRIILTLDLVSGNMEEKTPRTEKTFKHYFEDVTQRLADKITNTIHLQNDNNKTLNFELQAPPEKRQWLWPISLLILFFVVSG